MTKAEEVLGALREPQVGDAMWMCTYDPWNSSLSTRTTVASTDRDNHGNLIIHFDNGYARYVEHTLPDES